MYNAGNKRASVYVVSHHEDTPITTSGLLIPPSYVNRAAVCVRPSGGLTPKIDRSVLVLRVPHRTRARRVVSHIAVVMTMVVLLAVITTGTQLTLQGTATMAAPIVVVSSDEFPEPRPLHYGVQPILSHPNFFSDTHDRFIADKLTFIEADLTNMTLRYFEEGVEAFTAPILSKGKEGSWWETPAGLYQIELKEENHFSSFGNVYQPWSMVFQGNFFIHGWPKHPSGAPVPEGYSGGCIRLGDADAEALFKLVSEETPVLVHEADFENDDFTYEPKGPQLTAPHYLVADIKNNSILASSDLDEVVPIASVAKLMTALVAAEYINLDTTVYVSKEQYVSTLIPRLDGRWRVSMYSLLQLLLVESSNEAAEVVAAQVGRERFIELMNEKALALGLTHTTFTDPSGLDDGNVSTVSDLMRLVQYIHYNRSFILDITHDQDLPTAYKSGEFGELENFNLVEGVDSFVGGKVGETHAAGQTSVTLHRLNINGEERMLVFVILGSTDRSADVRALVSYVTSQFVR